MKVYSLIPEVWINAMNADKLNETVTVQMKDGTGFTVHGTFENINKLQEILNKPKTYLTKQEIIILYNHLSHEFISYENIPVIELMKKITRIAHDELDKQSS